MELVKDLGRGFVIGVANIIPGVSGGTLALVLGIYQRLIMALRSISFDTVKRVLAVLSFNRRGLDSCREELKRIDAFFLIKITAGALVSIVALASIMTYLLQSWHDPTYGFFFGLVLVSAVAPFRLIRKKNFVTVIIVLVSAGSLVALSGMMSGEKLVEKARIKYEMKQHSEPGAVVQETGSAADTTAQIKKMIWIFVMGAFAISAMILPGISGSFLLLLMGGYFDILRAISTRDFPVLSVFALGCLAGIVVFSRFLDYLLRKWHDETMGFLIGLVLGSLWIIWPFKTNVLVGDEVIYLANKIPAGFGVSEAYTALSFFAGAAIVAVMLIFEVRGGDDNQVKL